MEKDVSYICCMCKEYFSMENQAKIYSQVLSLESSFMCVHCTTPFSLGYEMVQPSNASEECDTFNCSKKALEKHSNEESRVTPKESKMHKKGIKTNSLNVLHSKEKNSKEKPHKFDMCLSAFKEKYGLTRNVQINEEQSTFKCEKCNRIFLRKSGLEGHMARHLDRTPFKCEVCNSAFRYKYKLKAHKRNSKICGKHSVTESPHSLQQKAKPRKYDICLSAYNKKYGLTGDGKIREEKNTFNREKCDICSQKSRIEGHICKHLEQRPFTCVVCHSTYKHKSHLTAHMRLHDEHNPFKCVKCDKKCRSKSDLTRHMTAHTDYRPLKCDICSSTFKTKASVRIHKKIHEKCEHCNTYHSKSDLKTQITENPEFVMTEEGNYECSVCYVTFDHICHLKWHMKKHEEDNK